MAKAKLSGDVNKRAKSIVDIATGESQAINSNVDKNPVAVALGRLGGLKGGKARAEKLTAKKRVKPKPVF